MDDHLLAVTVLQRKASMQQIGLPISAIRRYVYKHIVIIASLRQLN